jgi:hypothetical protein
MLELMEHLPPTVVVARTARAGVRAGVAPHTT